MKPHQQDELDIPAVRRGLAHKHGKAARRLWVNDLADFLARIYAAMLTPTAVSYVLALDADELEAALNAYQNCLEAAAKTGRIVARRLAAVRFLVAVNRGAEPAFPPLRATDELLGEEGAEAFRWPPPVPQDNSQRANQR